MTMTFRSHTTYPLLDTERYDDEFGTGYAFAAVAVEDAEGMRIVDCWVVDRRGRVHPGLAECPVPISIDALDTAGSFPTPAATRGRNASASGSR